MVVCTTICGTCLSKEMKVKGMNVNKKWLILAVFFLVLNMVAATQYAVTRVGYEYYIVHPSNADIRYIGSDNSSDNIRVLRVSNNNSTGVGIKLFLGEDFTLNSIYHYSAAFGIVNENNYAVNITHINVSSFNHTYLKIWLHGDRDANANSTATDNSSVFMWNNNTLVNLSNTTAWTLAAGNENPNDMCYNISDRTNCSINTTWDDTAGVRYCILNDTAVNGTSDFIWVQVSIDIPSAADVRGNHFGTIEVHFKANTINADR